MATIVDELISILGYEIQGEGNLKKYQAGMEGAAKSVNRLTARIVAYSAAADKAFDASRSMAIPSALAVLYAKRIKDAALQTEGWDRAFNAVTGSAEAAQDEIEDAAYWSDLYGASVTKVTENWVKFKAATKGTDVAKDAEEIFRTFTAVSVTLGQSGEQLDGALKAVEQMVSKGKVQAEELRGQLGERVYGAFIKAAEAMGITTAELDKMLEQGQVVASDLLPKLAKQLQKDYKLDLGERIESDIATFARLENSLFMLKVAIARSGFIDFLADLAEGLTKVVKRVAAAPPWVHKLITAIIMLTAVSAPLLWTFGAIAKSISMILKAVLAVRSLATGIAVLAGLNTGGGLLPFIKSLRVFAAAAIAASLPLLKIAAIVAAVLLGLEDLYHFLTGGKSVIGALVDQLTSGDIFAYGQEIGQKIVHGIFEGARQLGELGDKIQALLSSPEFYKVGWDIIKSIVSGLALAVVALGAAFAKIAAGIFWGIVNALVGFDAREKLTLMVTDLIETIVNAWESLINFYDLGVQMVSQLFDGMKSIGGRIKAWFADLVPDWARDFIGGGDVEAKVNNLQGNLGRSGAANTLSPASINNQSSRNSQVVKNEINIEQNVQKPTDAPGQLAKSTANALRGVMPDRAQLQQEPINP